MEEKIVILENILQKDIELVEQIHSRWLAIKLLERDAGIYALVHERPIWLEVEPALRTAIPYLEKHYEQDIKTSFVESRYAFIRGALQETVKFLPKTKNSITQYIDDILIS